MDEGGSQAGFRGSDQGVGTLRGRAWAGRKGEGIGEFGKEESCPQVTVLGDMAGWRAGRKTGPIQPVVRELRGGGIGPGVEAEQERSGGF
jgi:hypothetical protein